MKKLLSIAALSLLALSSLLTAPSQAATAQGTFDVTINLTSKCEVVSAPAAAFTYTSFQAAVAAFSSSFNVRCTNGLPISSIRLDDGAGGVAAGLFQDYTDQATNLAYRLTLSGVPVSGNGANQAVTIDGSMALGQAGTCTTATCTNAASTNKTRTITLAY